MKLATSYNTFPHVRASFQQRIQLNLDFPEEEPIDASLFGNGLGELKKSMHWPSPSIRLLLDYGSNTDEKIKHGIFEEKDMRRYFWRAFV